MSVISMLSTDDAVPPRKSGTLRPTHLSGGSGTGPAAAHVGVDLARDRLVRVFRQLDFVEIGERRRNLESLSDLGLQAEHEGLAALDPATVQREMAAEPVVAEAGNS